MKGPLDAICFPRHDHHRMNMIVSPWLLTVCPSPPPRAHWSLYTSPSIGSHSRGRCSTPDNSLSLLVITASPGAEHSDQHSQSLSAGDESFESRKKKINYSTIQPPPRNPRPIYTHHVQPTPPGEKTLMPYGDRSLHGHPIEFAGHFGHVSSTTLPVAR